MRQGYRLMQLGMGLFLIALLTVLPMLAKRVEVLSVGSGWIFEPKWDGFRALIFVISTKSIQEPRRKASDPLLPELLDPLCSNLPARCVLDAKSSSSKITGSVQIPRPRFGSDSSSMEAVPDVIDGLVHETFFWAEMRSQDIHEGAVQFRICSERSSSNHTFAEGPCVPITVVETGCGRTRHSETGSTCGTNTAM